MLSIIGCGPDGILSEALFAVLLLRTTDAANGCPPSYARSTPPTYLESGAPPQKRRRQCGEDENNDVWEHCEQPFRSTYCRRISTIVGSGYGWIIVLDLERLHLLS